MILNFILSTNDNVLEVGKNAQVVEPQNHPPMAEVRGKLVYTGVKLSLGGGIGIRASLRN